jgi:hypothetical protein
MQRSSRCTGIRRVPKWATTHTSPDGPSHVLHTFWIGNLRLVLDAVLTSGKQHTSGHAKVPLKRLLDELGERQPALVRGDCGYGNQDIIEVCEERGLPYLLRLRQTANVKELTPYCTSSGRCG